jgi:dihydrofolate reductase
MRKVFWQMMVSLDGFAEGPNGELDWHVIDEDFNRYVEEMGKTIDAMIFGRVTYEMMAAYWPTSTEPEARMMNELPKVVFSKKLDRVDWQNSRLVKNNVAEEVRKLKDQRGKDIAIFGSADLASDLLQMGLIDEVRVMVNPLVLGAGKPMFKDVKGPIKLKLTKSETSSGGNVSLYYEPEKSS